MIKIDEGGIIIPDLWNVQLIKSPVIFGNSIFDSILPWKSFLNFGTRKACSFHSTPWAKWTNKGSFESTESFWVIYDCKQWRSSFFIYDFISLQWKQKTVSAYGTDDRLGIVVKDGGDEEKKNTNNNNYNYKYNHNYKYNE